MRHLASAALAFALLVPVAAQAQVSGLDLDRFDGRWFEIARSPNDVQKDCSRAQIDFTATNRADRYGITVACTRRADGRVETLRADARIDPSNNAKFRFTLRGVLSFGGLAGQNYWVQAHAPDYSWAILSLPNKSDWWIWSRSQSPSAAVRSQTLARARQLGLNTSQVVTTGG
ncbi:MAG TPA: lipocalin family protein [Brevundimonas sp.]|jgi:apolipoprotein D and lipocalin family protein|uniref:lipocalin family protein n=1 Tax=Brevundimonas sp. TaxID=1871086 RepID=UPI002DEB40F9|nr:lipocalin family protein [Brevundimonas sp.]